ncbi:MAG: fumarylacetoacetate hydrolase family protein [Salibacteraceae bacterium]|jgi:acylpyruvate hydrolase|nr:fumarylacetoacetate hydrolase family protein [Salibacteraceae bacterium]MDP4687263.1 fumarylacetoacetate hydrolase family protein [Salibacteraceae bacterium]MDP4844375.1 fumarylacetoacetate hydrolase family protein [Salibacteraceae bacterium]MDP4934255.1 fumarylacetoacetate hydrolase family protein [Salibacteraceae bacterium]
MKIICIGRNYADHAKELKNEVPTEPVFFMKPDTALLKPKQAFFLPDFSKEVHHELELVVRINRLGKNIEERFAHRYYNEIGLGIDFTARDLQQQCKEKGLPWEKAKAFDGSAPLGDFIPVTDKTELNNLKLELKLNGTTKQLGNTKDMIFSIDKIIAYISQFMTLKIGDLIFTGTPAGVGPVAENDLLEGFLNDQQLLTLRIK